MFRSFLKLFLMRTSTVKKMREQKKKRKREEIIYNRHELQKIEGEIILQLGFLRI
jgi:hypothetical protein